MKRPTASEVIARYIAEQAVRNGRLEDLHSGITPQSKAGDYSDVSVVTPYGEIPWKEVSRVSDPELRVLMLQVEQSLAGWLQAIGDLDDSEFEQMLVAFRDQYFGPHGVSWDRPQGSPAAPAAPAPIPDNLFARSAERARTAVRRSSSTRPHQTPDRRKGSEH